MFVSFTVGKSQNNARMVCQVVNAIKPQASRPISSTNTYWVFIFGIVLGFCPKVRVGISLILLGQRQIQVFQVINTGVTGTLADKYLPPYITAFLLQGFRLICLIGGRGSCCRKNEQGVSESNICNKFP